MVLHISNAEPLVSFPNDRLAEHSQDGLAGSLCEGPTLHTVSYLDRYNAGIIVKPPVRHDQEVSRQAQPFSAPRLPSRPRPRLAQERGWRGVGNTVRLRCPRWRGLSSDISGVWGWGKLALVTSGASLTCAHTRRASSISTLTPRARSWGYVLIRPFLPFTDLRGKGLLGGQLHGKRSCVMSVHQPPSTTHAYW
ncbi:hypothetical protein EX30DRAFT_220372 [Ascodesmis nigricans]|uniref:Uncharacterized protein n=1 Tax=Ascodesmis nigricans TaxID=341454 RepID=A0A4S2MZT7_9PEZI|nr:hypothetical protein EX30DRAFT_220372 [Ascodesmis nigricans]